MASSLSMGCRYTPDEARALKSYGELPANAKINETDAFGDEEGGGGGIDFQDSGSESGSEEEEDAQNDLDIDDVRTHPYGLGAYPVAAGDGGDVSLLLNLLCVVLMLHPQRLDHQKVFFLYVHS